MRFLFLCLVVVLAACSGCVSKAKCDLRAREAYLKGQQEATAKQKNQAKFVIVRGDVKNEVVPWTEDMTVAKAIVAAEYLGLVDPKRIIVIHDDKPTEIKPSDLLNGKDLPLEAGDVVVLRKNL